MVSLSSGFLYHGNKPCQEKTGLFQATITIERGKDYSFSELSSENQLPSRKTARVAAQKKSFWHPQHSKGEYSLLRAPW